MHSAGARSVVRYLGCILCVFLLLFNYSEPMRSLRALPDTVFFSETNPLDLSAIKAPFYKEELGALAVAGDMSEHLYAQRLRIKLFGVIPFREVNVLERESVMVMPGGQSIGVTIYTDGALVVGLQRFKNEYGEYVCPARDSGIKPGDVIIEVNGMYVNSSETLVDACASLDGDGSIRIRVLRGKSELTFTVTPAFDGEQARLGMWVRDSTAGIGTFSFYDMETLEFGALGHAVTDVDLGNMLRIGNGEICLSEIVGVNVGTHGSPGELRGNFSYGKDAIGDIQANTRFGIFGRLYDELVNPIYPDGVPLAYPDEVTEGKASLLSTVDGGQLRAFDCEIVKLYDQASEGTKSIILTVTDHALLELTGGIVQGMSGSPIIQDGKLVGIVTHVFVNDPAKGYGVYAYWMYNYLEKLHNR